MAMTTPYMGHTHTHTHAKMHTHTHVHKGWSLPYTVSHDLGWQSNEVQGQEALEIRVNRSGGIFRQLVKGSNGRFSDHYITDYSSICYGQGSSSQFCCGQRVKHSNCGIKKFWPTMAMTTPFMGVTHPLHTHTLGLCDNRDMPIIVVWWLLSR